MKRTTILSLLAALPLATGVAMADRGAGRGHWHHDGARLERQLGEVGLDARQKAKVDEIFADAKKDREENRAKLREAHQALRTLLEQDSPDRSAIDRQVEKLGEMKTEAHKAKLHTLLAVRAELTREQREKLKSMKREKRAHRSHDRGADRDAAPESQL
ncbi:MAG: Spy/CpxP family protein refolding chaperone [Candidatus Binatia bacterium]